MSATRRPHYHALLLTLAVLGCTGGSETGNPAEPAQMGLSLHTSDPKIADVRRGTEGVLVEAAWLGIRNVSFVPAGSPEDMEDFEIEGLIVTDLVDTRAGVQQFMLVPGDYSSVRAELSRAGLPLPLGAPAELETSSLVVQGLTASGRRFTIAVDDEMDIDIVAAMGSFLVAPERSRLVLSFDIAQWFSDIDLDALAPSSDGSVRVDADTNTDALTAFEASFLGALELGLDRNGNATLDDDEERLARGEAP